jgi:hypothetical protein
MSVGASLREHLSVPTEIPSQNRVLRGVNGGSSIDDHEANPGAEQVGVPPRKPCHEGPWQRMSEDSL